MRQRPISVTVFGILNIGFGLCSFAGLLVAGMASRMKLPGNSALATLGSDPVRKAWFHFSVVIDVALGTVLIASGIGFLLLQNWARVLAFIYSLLKMIFVLADAVFNQRSSIEAVVAQIHGIPSSLVDVIVNIILVIGVVLGLAYPVLLLIYITRPKVTEAFKAPDLQEPH